ncbi:hypothetical protein HY970_02040 [Candidatus Kaiserbacteria bacterium]|nr:hypothetical protein [Candidatus Kaiserbacteria bacterium]
MIRKNETLRPKEELRTPSDLPVDSDTIITTMHAEEIFRARKALLASIRIDIRAPFYDVLQRKIEFERSSLLTIVDDEKKIVETKRKLDRVLKSEYFIQKRLDITFC